MRGKNLRPSKLPTTVFFVILQIFFNLHSTIVGNDARNTTADLMNQLESKDNEYWFETREDFHETLQLPVAVHPVILDYLPLVSDDIRKQISELINECVQKKVSLSDFNELQSVLVRTLMRWKYKHELNHLNEGLSWARSKVESLSSIPEGSSDVYETLYDKFLKNPVPREKKEDLWPPEELKDSPLVPSDLQKVFEDLPIWCRLKASVLALSIEHFPAKWHNYAYRRLVRVLRNYYVNVKKIAACDEPENEQSICLRENEEMLASNLTSEVNEYTTYFEKNDPWLKVLRVGQILTLKLESFTYPDILVLAQGVPFTVHKPLRDLYDCFRIKRRQNADEITKLQRSLRKLLLTYRNDENDNWVKKYLPELSQKCNALASSAVSSDRRTASSFSFNRSVFSVLNPPSTLIESSTFSNNQETDEGSASVEEDSSAGETDMKFISRGNTQSNVISAKGVKNCNIYQGGTQVSITDGGVSTSRTMFHARIGERGADDHEIMYSAPSDATVYFSANSLKSIGQGLCKLILDNSFHRLYFQNSG